MFRTAALVLLLAAPAAAQQATFVDDPDQIMVENRVTHGLPDTLPMVVETPHGRVRMLYRQTRNNGVCEIRNHLGCADLVEVLEAPPGYVVIPQQQHVRENRGVLFDIVPFRGS